MRGSSSSTTGRRPAAAWRPIKGARSRRSACSTIASSVSYWRASSGGATAVDAAAEMRRRVTEKLAAGPGLTVAEIRDLLGTTRKYAVPICEYLDKAGATKRQGDLRVAAG